MIKQSFKFQMSSSGVDDTIASVFGIVQDVQVQLNNTFTLRPAGVNGDNVTVHIAYNEIKGKVSLSDVILSGNTDVVSTEDLVIDPGAERVITLSCDVPHSTDMGDNSALANNGVWSMSIPGCFKSGFSESLTNLNGKFYKTSSLVFDVRTKEQF